MRPTFVAPTPWSAERPETLVVCCSDGRWHAQMVEFVHNEVSQRADLYAVPGGPAVLDPWNSSFDEARAFEASMRLFAGHHNITGVWLIAHEGCAWYATKHPHFEPREIRQRQIEDLRRARELLLERYPAYEVRLIFAAHRGDSVVFDVCDPAVQERLT
jgi:hypothetical protein